MKLTSTDIFFFCLLPFVSLGIGYLTAKFHAWRFRGKGSVSDDALLSVPIHELGRNEKTPNRVRVFLKRRDDVPFALVGWNQMNQGRPFLSSVEEKVELSRTISMSDYQKLPPSKFFSNDSREPCSSLATDDEAVTNRWKPVPTRK